MTRKSLDEEVENREAVKKAILKALRPSYIPPTYIADGLKAEGKSVTRQLVTRHMNEMGIFWDETAGLWLRKEQP